MGGREREERKGQEGERKGRDRRGGTWKEGIRRKGIEGNYLTSLCGSKLL